ncbi:MAG TPA: hypothetical protein VF553_16855 [Pyrinomonadaceae bacterium]
MRTALVWAFFCPAAVALNGCGGAQSVTSQNTTSGNQATASNNANAPGARVPQAAASPKAAAAATGSTGEFVDTSKSDAEIKRLEDKAKKNPADQATRLALAKAYADRGDALTGVRQYRAALGDYRRALRHDPNNEQARQMAGTITGILKSMGRDVPPEGQEPPPLKQ